MRSIYITLTAVSALTAAAPLAAQSWQGPAPLVAQPQQGQWPTSDQLQARFDAGIESGAISRIEARPLRMQLRQLVQMERNYSRAGFNAWETQALRERSRTLTVEMNSAERSGNGRYGPGQRYGAGAGFNDGRGNGMGGGYAEGNRGHRGDRYAGDVRVGERFSDRQIALPVQYRDRYRDDNASFYRYDDDRIYQIDRNTGLILAMFDIGR